jgi:Uma2 family endonuclease
MPTPKRKISKKSEFTLEEYLEFERASETRHEFFDGEVRQMAGESGEHADISANLIRLLGNSLYGTDCRVRAKDTKVRSGFMPPKSSIKKGMISYPDLVVICGEPEYHDKHRDVVLNPRVIIEVLSESTAEFDRTDKFHRYQICNPTLTDYVLVSQDKCLVEHFVKQDDGTWKYFFSNRLDSQMTIDSINCSLRLADIFYLINFPKSK